MLDAAQIIRDQSAMETARAPFEQEWQDVAQLMLPSLATQLLSSAAPLSIPQRPRQERIYDETARQALKDGCSVFEGETIPQGSTWQPIKPADEDLLKQQHIALWFERLTAKVFKLRYAAQSGFVTSSNASIKNLLGFGLQGFWPDIRRNHERRPIGISYRAERAGQIYVRENDAGLVDTTHRKFTLSHRNALGKWPDNPPECAAKARRDGRGLDDEASYLHVIAPNPSYDAERIDWRGKPFYSCYVSLDDQQLFDEGGYRTRRLIVSRFEKDPGATYGRGPAMDILPAVKAAQEIMADLVTAIEFMARPVLGAHDDMLDQILNYSPGGVSYGAIDDRGNQLIKRLWEDPDIGPALQLQAEVRKLIERAFFQDLYMIREEVKSHVSAFERMKRDQQKGVLLTPFARQESEWWSPLLNVELDLMAEMGMLDDMPREVAESGGLFACEYDNPLNAARRSDAAAGFYGLLDGLSPLMQLDPQNTVQTFFEKYPFAKVLDGLAPIHRVPVAWESTKQERAAAAEEARALADKASLLEVGERASAIAKNLSGLEVAA